MSDLPFVAAVVFAAMALAAGLLYPIISAPYDPQMAATDTAQATASPQAVCAAVSRAYAAGQGDRTDADVTALLDDLVSLAWGLPDEQSGLRDLVLELDTAWTDRNIPTIDSHAAALGSYCHTLPDARKTS